MKGAKRTGIQLLLGVAGIAIIRLYLRLFGRTVQKADVPGLLARWARRARLVSVLTNLSRTAKGSPSSASAGAGFGDAGFYRLPELDAEQLKVRYFRTLRERFEVYSDEHNVLRCDHEIRFVGIPVLRLHYRMRRRTS